MSRSAQDRRVLDGPTGMIELFAVLGVMGEPGARNWQHSLIRPNTCLLRGPKLFALSVDPFSDIGGPLSPRTRTYNRVHRYPIYLEPNF